MFNGNNGELDILSLISIILGYSNLIENRQQSAHNDVEKQNEKQAQKLLSDIHKQFDFQNNLLHQILNILKGDEKNGL